MRQTVLATKAEELLLASLRLMANQIEVFAQLNWERVGCHRSMYQKSPLSNYLYLSTAQFNDTAFQTRNIKRETPVDVVILFLFPCVDRQYITFRSDPAFRCDAKKDFSRENLLLKLFGGRFGM